MKKDELTAKDMKAKELKILNERHYFRNQGLNTCNGKSQGISFKSDSIETIKNMVQSNMGFNHIPELAIDPVHDKDCLCKFSHPKPTGEVSIVTHISFTHQRLFAHLQDSITRKIQNNIRKNKDHMTIK